MTEKLAHILLLVPSMNRLYSYKIPENLLEQAVIGARVKVPVRRSTKEGYILKITDETPDTTEIQKLREIKEVVSIPPLPKGMIDFLKWLSNYYIAPLGQVFKTALPRFVGRGPKQVKYYEFQAMPETPIRSEKAMRILAHIRHIGSEQAQNLRMLFPSSDSSVRTLLRKGLIRITYQKAEIKDHGQVLDDMNNRPADLVLTSEQEAAIKEIEPLVGKEFKAFLLHGVTGSGKTEVYMDLISRALEQGKTALVLVPEIALTPQMAWSFKTRLHDQVAVLHSALTPAQRADMWYRVLKGEVRVVLGVRSAIFAPLQDLGIIVVDEEHESTYKQEHGFRYNARDGAIVRGMLEKCPVVLGSATPSLDSFNNAATGKYIYISLPRRVSNRPMPEIEFVDLRFQGEATRQSLISPVLEDALKQVISRHEQAILFLNRKGFAPFLLCKDCGKPVQCPHCSVSLTLHHNPQRLICHYCDYTTGIPDTCPTCGSKELVNVGVGLQRVMEELQQRFPDIRLAKLDADTASTKRLGPLLNTFARGGLDVILGTQILAKGHDFPGVTLVAVLLAELSLGMPDFRAAERTFGLITQVAGRAGRGDKPGKVIVQTYQTDHYVLKYAATHDYTGFAVVETGMRKQRGYPPFVHMATVWFSGRDPTAVRNQAVSAANILRSAAKTGLNVLGPLKASIFKVREHYRFQLLLKAGTRQALNEALWRMHNAIGRGHHGVSVEIDVDPMSLL